MFSKEFRYESKAITSLFFLREKDSVLSREAHEESLEVSRA